MLWENRFSFLKQKLHLIYILELSIYKFQEDLSGFEMLIIELSSPNPLIRARNVCQLLVNHGWPKENVAMCTTWENLAATDKLIIGKFLEYGNNFRMAIAITEMEHLHCRHLFHKEWRDVVIH